MKKYTLLYALIACAMVCTVSPASSPALNDYSLGAPVTGNTNGSKWSLYNTLGITRNQDKPPTVKDIKSAYLKLVRQLHPDKNPNLSSEETDRWTHLQSAYSALHGNKNPLEQGKVDFRKEYYEHGDRKSLLQTTMKTNGQTGTDVHDDNDLEYKLRPMTMDKFFEMHDSERETVEKDAQDNKASRDAFMMEKKALSYGTLGPLARSYMKLASKGLMPHVLGELIDLYTLTSPNKKTLLAGGIASGVGRFIDFAYNKPFVNREFGVRLTHLHPTFKGQQENLSCAFWTNPALLGEIDRYHRLYSIYPGTYKLLRSLSAVAALNKHLEVTTEKKDVAYRRSLYRWRLFYGLLLVIEYYFHISKYKAYLGQSVAHETLTPQEWRTLLNNNAPKLISSWKNAAIAFIVGMIRRSLMNRTKETHIRKAQKFAKHAAEMASI